MLCSKTQKAPPCRGFFIAASPGRRWHHRKEGESTPMYQSKRFKFRWVATPVLLLLVFLIWSSDRVTLQGERTVYTVTCAGDAWVGNQCRSVITAGPRFRYRALRARGEVLFWVLGVQEPSSKLTGCTIQDGRNWTCPASDDAPKSLTLGIARGEPLRNPAWPTLPFHSVSKVTWLLLDVGFKFVPMVD